jgi:hypothetical protein
MRIEAILCQIGAIAEYIGNAKLRACDLRELLALLASTQDLLRAEFLRRQDIETAGKQALSRLLGISGEGVQ